MRIIAGKSRGTRLSCPSGQNVRPTSDRVREAIFQILETRYMIFDKPIAVLDLFAGTGSLGLEAFSRGAEQVVFVETSARHIRYLLENIKKCSAGNSCKIIRAHIPLSGRAINNIKHEKGFGLVLADPPYSRELAKKAAEQVLREGLLAENGVMVIEEFRKTVLPEQFTVKGTTLFSETTRKYGQTGVWFYVRA